MALPFIVPFVSGMLANLAARKTTAIAKEAKSAEMLAEHGYRMQEKQFEAGIKMQELSHATHLKQMDLNAKSFFPGMANSYLTWNTTPIDKRDNLPFQLNEDQEWMMQKLTPMRARFESGNQIADSTNFISQFSMWSDSDWARIGEIDTDGYVRNKVRSAILGQVGSLDRAIRGREQTATGWTSGNLSYEELGWLEYPEWLKRIVTGEWENKGGVFNQDGSFTDPDDISFEISPTDYGALRFAHKDMVPNIKPEDADKLYQQSALNYAIYETPPSVKENSGNKYITAAQGADALSTDGKGSTPVRIGWLALGDIFTKRTPNGNIIAKAEGAAPYSSDALPDRVNYLTNYGANFVMENNVPGWAADLIPLGYYFPWLELATFQINAGSAIANNYNLPGLKAIKGTKHARMLTKIYPDANAVLEKHLHLTPTFLSANHDLASIGGVAYSTSVSITRLIHANGLAGTAFFKLAKGKDQIFQLIPNIANALGLTEGGFTENINTEAFNTTFDAKIAEAEEMLKNVNEDSLEYRNITTSLDMLKRHKEDFNKRGATILSNVKGDKNNQGVVAARLELLRTALVFYAAAIFQGEGGKAISDGDRKQVERALAITTWGTKNQALGALSEFRKAMAPIIAKAKGFTQGTVKHAYSALHYDNLYLQEGSHFTGSNWEIGTGVSDPTEEPPPRKKVTGSTTIILETGESKDISNEVVYNQTSYDIAESLGKHGNDAYQNFKKWLATGTQFMTKEAVENLEYHLNEWESRPETYKINDPNEEPTE